jgi:hypothetical protein
LIELLLSAALAFAFAFALVGLPDLADHLLDLLDLLEVLGDGIVLEELEGRALCLAVVEELGPAALG